MSLDESFPPPSPPELPPRNSNQHASDNYRFTPAGLIPFLYHQFDQLGRSNTPSPHEAWHPHEFVSCPKQDNDGLPMTIICKLCHRCLDIRSTLEKKECSTLLTHHYHYNPPSRFECCGCHGAINVELRDPVLIPQAIQTLAETRPLDREPGQEIAPNLLDTLIVLLTFVSNLLKGDRRSINGNNQNLVTKMGLDDSSKRIMADIGYTLNPETFHFDPPENIDLHRLCAIRAQLLVCLYSLRHDMGRDVPRYAAVLDEIRISVRDLLPIVGVDEALEKVPYDVEPAEQSIGEFLGSVSGATDDVLIWLFHRLIDEEPEKASSYMAVLTQLAHQRQSDALLTEVALETSKGLVDDTYISNAFSYYGLAKNGDMDNEYLKSLFEQRMKEDPENAQSHRANFEIIANARNSDTLREYIKKHTEEWIYPNRPFRHDEPIGLNNIGNTCYLNSLLQYYYTLVPLRETIIHLDEYVDNEEDPDWTPKKIGGIEVDRKEVKRAKKFVSNLRDLFINLGNASERAISPTYDLAYMALLNEKDFEETEESKSPTIVATDSSKNDKGADPPLAQSANNETPDDEQPPTYDEAVKDQDPVIIEEKKPKPPQKPSAANMMLGKQQDVTECMSNVMYLVEAALKPLEKKDDEQTRDIVRDLFYFKARQILTYEDTSTLQEVRKIQQEEFAHVIVDAVEGKDLYGGLDEYFFAGRVENFHGGRGATREVTVSVFPPVLQIQVQRVQFDRETSNVYKSNAFIKLEKTLYLDRYSEQNFEALAGRRTQVAGWQKELEKHKAIVHELTKDKAYPMPIPEMLEATAAILEDYCQENNEEQTEAYEKAFELLKARADQARCTIAESTHAIEDLRHKIRTQYDDLTHYAYKLHAVFIHQGQANYGHYWVYIYDHKRDQWWKYNDSLVTKVDESEIYLDTTGLTANPYFVVYVRVADMDDIVENKPDDKPQNSSDS